MHKLLHNLTSFSDQEKLLALTKDYSSEELIQILESLLEIEPKIKSELSLFDCCGTGGDQANTFNISTAAAILAATTGIKVCKNGGRSSTSKTGSVDVLEELGLNLSQSLETKLIGLEKFGLAFHNSKAIAETLAPLKNYARANKISSFLSLLGPFTNPFLLKVQIIGVGKEAWFEQVSDLAKHSIKKNYCQKIALIQSQADNGQVFDELTSLTNAKIRFLTKEGFFDFDFNPGDFGFETGDLAELQGGTKHSENAEILNSVITNKASKFKKETCLLNTALLLSLDQEISASNLKELLNHSYLIAKEKLENQESLENWQNFLSHI